jgi:single-strand DNA-binding protein
MARGVNKAILLGNVGKEPELRYTQNGTAVCNFTLATTERRKVGGEWQDQTEWHNLVAWGKLAETCSNFLGKGSQVYIEGRIQTRKWEDRDGNSRYSTEVVANQMVLLGRPKGQRPDAGGYGDSYSPGGGSKGPADDFPGPDEDFDPNDDVPF